MIYKILESLPQDILPANSALHLYSLLKGANLLRVHDVKEAQDVLKLWKILK